VDGVGNLYIADAENHRIRRVDGTGRISTVAGTGMAGYDGDDKPAHSVRLNLPQGVVVNGSGALYIADASNARIRLMDVVGRITTLAGRGDVSDDGDDKPATSISLWLPSGVAVDGSGNLFIADTENNRIRRVDSAGRIATVAGTGVRGYDGDDKPATSAKLSRPSSVAVDESGNLFLADSSNSRIRRVDARGRITTVAGTGVHGYDGDDKPATSAMLNFPRGVAVDGTGNLYLAEAVNPRVRRVDIAGRITTVAGTGLVGYDGDGIPATSARFYSPFGLALDGAGNLYIADAGGNRIRRVDVSGQISTVAGTGSGGYDGDARPATAARLFGPTGVAADGAGNIYIADTYNNRIRRVDVTGQISTIAGTGVPGYDGDDKPATSARLYRPASVAVDESGNLYIADSYNGAIRAVKGPGTGGGGNVPRVESALYNSAKRKLTVVGSGFGESEAVVTVNGRGVSAQRRKQTDTKLVLKGTVEQFGLVSGDNQIVVTAGGRASNTYVLRL
jgi:sugar lactone lactonase YvrE